MPNVKENNRTSRWRTRGGGKERREKVEEVGPGIHFDWVTIEKRQRRRGDGGPICSHSDIEVKGRSVHVCVLTLAVPDWDSAKENKTCDRVIVTR